MKKPAPRPATRAPDADMATAFCAAIGALGDYRHVTVRPRRGLLYVYADETTDAVARFHPLGGGTWRDRAPCGGRHFRIARSWAATRAVGP